jgi:hypothetical protein
MAFILSTKERKNESMNERLKDMRRNPGWQRGTLVKSDGVAGSHSCLRHVSCVQQLSLSLHPQHIHLNLIITELSAHGHKDQSNIARCSNSKTIKSRRPIWRHTHACKQIEREQQNMYGSVEAWKLYKEVHRHQIEENSNISQTNTNTGP